MCVICMKYYHYQPGSNIIIVYIANTLRMHAREHTPPSPFRLSLFDGSVAPNRDGVNASLVRTHHAIFIVLSSPRPTKDENCMVCARLYPSSSDINLCRAAFSAT